MGVGVISRATCPSRSSSANRPPAPADRKCSLRSAGRRLNTQARRGASAAIEQIPVYSEARDEVDRLRYQVYVLEKEFCQKYVDHHDRTISEPLDQDGHVYAAWVDGRLVGTVRSNY